MTLPPNYRFRPEDVTRAMDTEFYWIDNPDAPEPSDEELYIARLALKAEEMHRASRLWPTVTEVEACIAAEEAEQKRQKEKREREHATLCRLYAEGKRQ